MKTNANFTLTLTTKQDPHKVFKAIRDVRHWWSGYYNEKFSGDSQQLNDEFTFEAGDGVHYSKQKLVEVIPDERIVWLITEGALSFVEEKDEWVGTKVRFEISKKGEETILVFTHEGLSPALACYDSCSPAWTQYLIERLLPLINSADNCVNN